MKLLFKNVLIPAKMAEIFMNFVMFVESHEISLQKIIQSVNCWLCTLNSIIPTFHSFSLFDCSKVLVHC